MVVARTPLVGFVVRFGLHFAMCFSGKSIQEPGIAAVPHRHGPAMASKACQMFLSRQGRSTGCTVLSRFFSEFVCASEVCLGERKSELTVA